LDPFAKKTASTWFLEYKHCNQAQAAWRRGIASASEAEDGQFESYVGE
jgi:hypothetical protein